MEKYKGQLLSIEADAKTKKGSKKGYLTGVMYLAPAGESGVMNTCAFASAGCKADCLFTAGRASFIPSIITARIARTRFLHSNRPAFLTQLRKEIAALVRKATREGMTPCVRVNGTSDLFWLGKQLASEFPTIQFYDYTKNFAALSLTRPANYHLTFSRSELNETQSIEALARGLANVAVVFDSKRIPETWQGFPVVSGDETDLRFLDKPGCVIGLYAKGKAKKDTVSGFVVPVSSLLIPMSAR